MFTERCICVHIGVGFFAFEMFYICQCVLCAVAIVHPEVKCAEEENEERATKKNDNKNNAEEIILWLIFGRIECKVGSRLASASSASTKSYVWHYL